LDHYGIKNKVELLESIELERLYEFMKYYHIFIHPSCYTDDKDCEGGAPVVLLDAQATGMPVISTYHCDIPEVVVHQKTGLLTSEKNIDDLSKAIMKFYFMEQEEYDQYCENARHHMEKNYNIKISGKTLRKIYEDMLSSHTSS
jgi:colanic acid/amylovoran biosynthesis glycosyltransferase